MRRTWLWLPTLLVAVFAFLPAASHAAGFLAVIPSNGACTCPGSAPDFGCVLQTLQNLMNDFVTVATLFLTVLLAWAGITYILNPTSPEKRSQANARILNAIIGLMVVLCAWLLVDTVMKVLYNPSAGNWGPWNTILTQGVTSQADCIQSPKTTPNIGSIIGQLSNTQANITGSSPTAGNIGKLASGKGGTAQCSADNPACSVQALESAGLTQQQAQAMSCIAVSESSGNPNSPMSSTGACGTFQILAGHASSNWNNPAFHSGSCSTSSSCNDASCNLQTAVLMYKQSGYTPWICPGCNATAHACVANFDPGHGE